MQGDPAATSKGRAWLQLLRPPNLFTVPGDVLVGCWLALPHEDPLPSGLRLAATVAAVCLFYLAGLIMNDMADLAEDRRDRPDRPLPSGRISTTRAGTVMVLFMGLALLLLGWVRRRAMIFGFYLVAAIALYNLWAKRRTAFGPITMGLCRGFSLLIGAASVGPQHHPELYPGLVTGFEILLLYIAGLTLLARRETENTHPGLQVGFPLLMLAIGLLAFPSLAEARSPVSPVLFSVLALASLVEPARVMRAMWARGRVIPPDIGRLIRNLILIQAALLAWCAPPLWGLALLPLYPLAGIIGRWFYAS